MKKNCFVLLLGAAMVCGAAAAHAGGEPRTHDGFFLRLSAGGGHASSTLSPEGGEIELSGPAGDINIAVGGVVAPNLAIHGTLWGWSVSDPDADITVSGFGSGSGSLSGTFTMSAIGVGVTSYIMPANLYVSGSVGVARLNLDLDGLGDGNSDTGFALDVTLGKEWWVGNNWGLGVAGDFTYHSIPDPDVSENWSGPGFGIRFTATMN